MKIKYEYLNDYDFLKQLMYFPVKDYFVKIDLLNWEEDFLESIQGKITSANINIDGNSSIRRTANLNMYVQNSQMAQITDAKNIISINKKIYMEVGYLNPTKKYSKYKKIWFPIGLFVITNASISFGQQGINISLELKDKMVLLNGECGGTIPATTILDNYQTIDQNGNTAISKPTIYQIITELVNHFGKQQLGKIVISDVDDKVKQVMRWTGDKPLYILQREKQSKSQYIVTVNENLYKKYINSNFQNITGSPFSYNEDVGFILTDFTYPGELIATAGETVVSVLEKIKETLGNYEFFYDIDGNFIFQEIKNFVNNSPTEYILQSIRSLKASKTGETTEEKQARQKKQNDFLIKFLENNYTYLFNNLGRKATIKLQDQVILSYNNSPQFSAIKNDFVIWGNRKNGENGQIPIRYHLAIDEKPKTGEQAGQSYKVFKYYDDLEKQNKWMMPIKFDKKENFPQIGNVNLFYQSEDNGKIYKWTWDGQKYAYVEFTCQGKTITTKDWRTQLLFRGMTDETLGKAPNDYYAELLVEWPKIYDIQNGKFFEEVIKNPSGINYFLDFIDSQDLRQLNVENIGRRSYVYDYGNNINCIFQPYIPEIVYVGLNSLKEPTSAQVTQEECKIRGLKYYQIRNSIYEGLQIGGVLNSAYEEIKQKLNYYTSYNNNISIQTIPLFFLQPNTLIYLNNKMINVSGDFLIKSMSYSLDISSQLNINAIKNVIK